MGAWVSVLLGMDGTEAAAAVPAAVGLGDLPELCAAQVLLRFDPPEICRLAQLNHAFRGAAGAGELHLGPLHRRSCGRRRPPSARVPPPPEHAASTGCGCGERADGRDGPLLALCRDEQPDGWRPVLLLSLVHAGGAGVVARWAPGRVADELYTRWE
jgi:hypothetical protein